MAERDRQDINSLYAVPVWARRAPRVGYLAPVAATTVLDYTDAVFVYRRRSKGAQRSVAVSHVASGIQFIHDTENPSHRSTSSGRNSDSLDAFDLWRLPLCLRVSLSFVGLLGKRFAS